MSERKMGKKNIILIGFILLFLIIGFPIMVHILFKIKLTEDFWIAEWSAGEFLSYYASVLSFCGTICLSALALWQNEIIRRESSLHTKQLQKMETQKNCPFFSVKLLNSSIHNSNLEIELKNISQNPAIDIKNIVIKYGDDDQRDVKLLKISKDYLLLNDALVVNLNNPFINDSQKLFFEFECKDVYYNIYLFTIYYNNSDSSFFIKSVIKSCP